MNEYHRPKINALVEGGVDLLALETIPCKTEAEVLINLLKNEYPNVKAWLSFTCKVSALFEWQRKYTEFVNRMVFQPLMEKISNLRPYIATI